MHNDSINIICIIVIHNTSNATLSIDRSMTMFVKIPLSCLLILTSHLLYTMCFDCIVEDKRGSIKDCTKHWCGTLETIHCKESCDGVKCEKDEGCAGLCCKDGTCQSCGLSKTLVILIAVVVVVLVASLTIVVVCCCSKKPSAPRASGWCELHGTAWIRTTRKQVWIGTKYTCIWTRIRLRIELE